MKKIVFPLLIIVFLVSCNTRSDAEKVKAREAKKAAVGSGEEYNLIAEASDLRWKGIKPTGEHVGTVDITTGKVSADEGKITAGHILINMTTIVNEDITNPERNAKLVNHLKSEDFFHVSEFPTAAFEFVSVEKIENADTPAEGGIVPTHNVTGNLTMRGTTKSITFPARIESEGNKILVLSNPFAIDRTKWNVNFKSKSIFAELRDDFIHDDIILSLDLEFAKN